MVSLTTLEVLSQFDDILNRVSHGKERIEVTRDGNALVAIIPIADFRLLEELEDKLDIILARERLESYEKGQEKALSFDEVKQRLG